MHFRAFQTACFYASYTTAIQESVQCRKHIATPRPAAVSENKSIAFFEKLLYFFLGEQINFCLVPLNIVSVIEDIRSPVTSAVKITPKFSDR